MNEQQILLKEEPLLEVQIMEHGFMISNASDKNDNGIYDFDKVSSLTLEKKRINWFVSISSFIVDVFSGGATGGIFKEKDQLRFNYKTTEKRIMLDHCDIKETERIIQKIRRRVR